MRPIQLPQTEDGVLVAYSGGKDSLVVLDLAVKHFRRVEAFHMAFMPGLDYTRMVCDYAERRFKVPVHQISHWSLSTIFNEGNFCDSVDVRTLGMQAAIRTARAMTGLHWCGIGYRLQESLLQRRWLTKRSWHGGACCDDGRWAPIRDWKTRELITYLRRHRIVMPGWSAADGYKPSGIDLGPDALEWMRRCWPRDYQRVLAAFPLAAGQADRAALLTQRRSDYLAKRRAYDQARGNSSSRGYSYAWQKLRAEVLEAEPYCRMCLAKKLRVRGTNVDHIQTRREREALGLDPDARENLQSLCQECHSRKTATEDSAWARPHEQRPNPTPAV